MFKNQHIFIFVGFVSAVSLAVASNDQLRAKQARTLAVKRCQDEVLQHQKEQNRLLKLEMEKLRPLDKSGSKDDVKKDWQRVKDEHDAINKKSEAASKEAQEKLRACKDKYN